MMTPSQIRELDDRDLSALKAFVTMESDHREDRKHTGPCSRSPLRPAQGICRRCDAEENRIMFGDRS